MAELVSDVAVVGGGPAGTVAALTLARLGFRVVLVEGSRYGTPRVGETLAPAARPVLARLGLAQAVAALRSTPSYGNESVWGGPEVLSYPFIFGPYGNGWHLDRQQFDRMLADAAETAGARLLQGTRVRACTRQWGGSWRLTLDHGVDEITANALIDATGRSAVFGRLLGARRRLLDHLVGVAVRYGGFTQSAGYTLTEAVGEGWWYSAPIPPDQTMVMFMTDADLWRNNRAVWACRLAQTRSTALRIAEHEQLSAPAVFSAASHRLVRDGYADRWLAAGDAAIGVDPLSSSGILRALLTGEAAAYAIAHWLLGSPEAAYDYERWLDAEFDNYRKERWACYSLEKRWPHAPFWQRRLEGTNGINPRHPSHRDLRERRKGVA